MFFPGNKNICITYYGLYCKHKHFPLFLETKYIYFDFFEFLRQEHGIISFTTFQAFIRLQKRRINIKIYSQQVCFYDIT